MKRIVTDPRLIYKCCCLYYIDDMNQQEISEHIGISRASVSRMLKMGKDTGVVKVEIKNPVNLNYGDLERKLESKFHLKEVIITDSSPLDSKEEKQSRINAEALHYLSRLFKEGEYIGVSMGSTLYGVATANVEAEECISCTFIPVIGGIGSNQSNTKSIHANDIASHFANKFKGKSIQFFAPALFSDIDVMKGFMKETTALEVTKYYPKLTTLVMGIGIPKNTKSTLVQNNYIEAQKLQNFVDAGAVGDISLKFFDDQGNTEPFKEFNERVSGLLTSQTRQIKNRVVIATETEKAKAVRGAIKGGFINILITDAECAEELLKLEE